jgi:hypothetical protein
MIMILDQKPSLSLAAVELQFFASQTADVYYGARCSWYIAPIWQHIKSIVNAVVFYRRSFRKRVAGYALYLERWQPSDILRVSLEASFADVLAQLAPHGFTHDILWIPEERQNIYHYIPPRFEAELWNSNRIGVELRPKSEL